MNEEEALEISNSFLQYLNTENENLIARYSIKDLKMALRKIHLEQMNKPWYKEIEHRIEYLNKVQDKKLERREKWFDRFVGFVFGLLSSMILKIFF